MLDRVLLVRLLLVRREGAPVIGFMRLTCGVSKPTEQLRASRGVA